MNIYFTWFTLHRIMTISPDLHYRAQFISWYGFALNHPTFLCFKVSIFVNKGQCSSPHVLWTKSRCFFCLLLILCSLVQKGYYHKQSSSHSNSVKHDNWSSSSHFTNKHNRWEIKDLENQMQSSQGPIYQGRFVLS